MRCALLILPLGALVHCGSKKGDETAPPADIAMGQPIALSADSARDSRALGGSEEIIKLADWGKMSSGQNWSKIFGKPQVYGGKGLAPSQESRKRRTRDIPTFPRPDGKVQIYYRLEHFGGVTVTNTRKSFGDDSMITVAPNQLEPLVKVVQSHLGDQGTVAALPSENVLVITCAKEAKDSVMALMEHVDSGRKQVEIAVRIFEVSDDFDVQVGVNSLLKHLGTEHSQALLGNFSPAAFAGRIVDPLNGIGPDPGGMLNLVGMFQDAGVGIDITLEALERSGMVKVVSQPRMTVEAGQPAYMMAGQELPIREGRLTNDKFVTEKISYKPVGVQLHITPQSIGDGSVKLHIMTVVSAISGFAPLPELKDKALRSQLMNPVLDSRQAETRVEVPHGSTLAFGGLRMARQIGREEKIPILGDAPGIGKLFKNKRKQKTMSDLYFFVTPHLVSR
jgi:type II secretory pathway component GspD/PulD (secretin)